MFEVRELENSSVDAATEHIVVDTALVLTEAGDTPGQIAAWASSALDDPRTRWVQADLGRHVGLAAKAKAC